MASNYPSITLEEHFTSLTVNDADPNMWGPERASKLISLSSQRLQDMDAGHVSRQVISHTPFRTAPTPAQCRAINDELYAACMANPTRFSGFATLPIMHPADAAAELRRSVTELGFVGALLDNHSEGTFYDGEEFVPVWEEAVKLDVPIYLHPCFASDQMMQVNYRGNYPEDVAVQLSNHVYGWHTETGLHFLRLFAAGLFDRLPTLKLIIGHMGETIPSLLDRQIRATKAWTHLKRTLEDVWRTNVWVTTSGHFGLGPLICLLRSTILDHVLFSVDYPFSSNQMGSEFVKEIEKQGILTGEDLKAFVRGNAEKLLRVTAGV